MRASRLSALLIATSATGCQALLVFDRNDAAQTTDTARDSGPIDDAASADANPEGGVGDGALREDAATAVDAAWTFACPSNVLACDDFARPDQGGWGTATSGGVWSPTFGNAQFTLRNHEGHIVGSPYWETTLLSPNMGDYEVLAVYRLAPSMQAGPIVRGSGGNYYIASLDAPSFPTLTIRSFQNAVAGMSSGSKPVGASSPSATYGVRVRVAGTSLMARGWPWGSAEPGDWPVLWTDSRIASGSPGFAAVGGEAVLLFFEVASVK